MRGGTSCGHECTNQCLNRLASVHYHQVILFFSLQSKRTLQSPELLCFQHHTAASSTCSDDHHLQKCLRQRLAWSNRTSQRYDPVKEQYLVYPRAICDEEGNPQKGAKSNWTEKLRKRYTHTHNTCTHTDIILLTHWNLHIYILYTITLCIHEHNILVHPSVHVGHIN